MARPTSTIQAILRSIGLDLTILHMETRTDWTTELIHMERIYGDVLRTQGSCGDEVKINTF